MYFRVPPPQHKSVKRFSYPRVITRAVKMYVVVYT